MKYKFFVATNYVGCATEEVVDHEYLGFSEEEWGKLTEEEREDELLSVCRDWMYENIDWGWTTIKE